MRTFKVGDRVRFWLSEADDRIPWFTAEYSRQVIINPSLQRPYGTSRTGGETLKPAFSGIHGYEEYDGPQCVECGREDYGLRLRCLRCDALVCTTCLTKHAEGPHKGK